MDLAALLKKEGRTRVSISEKTGLGVCTVQAAIAGKNVTMHSADKIAEALGRSRLDLFIDVEKRKTLDANTVRGYHRLISSILTKAVKWGFIPFNPAANAELPKLMPKEAAHLDEEDARRLLELLQNEPAKYRAAISFDLLSGLRRGELLGLRWSDVDFENETVTIVQTSSYGASGDTELFEKASNINGFQGGRVANNLYISPFRATVFKTAALFLYLNSSVVIRVRKPLFFPL